MHDMSDLVARLKGLQSAIEKICRVSGTPGASIGILHHGRVIYTQGFGFRDVEAKLAPDQDTIYYLASLSKAITGIAVGTLVEHGKLKWTTPVREIVPDFAQDDKTIREQSTIVDWLSHRTGLASKNSMWSSEFGHASLKRSAVLPMISYLEKVHEFRTRWLYSNWGWALADEVIEDLSGETWGTFIKQHIFDPFGMHRTVTNHDTKLDNIAKAYMALSNGQPYHLPRPFPGDGKVMEGAVAVQSNVRDLLTLYKGLMEAAEDQLTKGTTSTPGNPLKQVTALLRGYIPLSPNNSGPERSYAIGWVRAELPTTLGAIGLNPTYVGKMPTVGKGLTKPHLCLYHQGSNNTFLSSVHLLPESHTAIVVLTNSMANNDAADWLGELLLETVLDNPQPNDYVKLAETSAAESKDRWVRMQLELEQKRIPNTSMRPTSSYCGSYWNRVGTYRLDIFQEQNQLKMCFQGDRNFSYDLAHYHHDTFSWLLTRDEDVHYGRFPVTRAEFYLLKFTYAEKRGRIEAVTWANDPAIPEGEIFREEGSMAEVAEVDDEEEAPTEGPA